MHIERDNWLRTMLHSYICKLEKCERLIILPKASIPTQPLPCTGCANCLKHRAILVLGLINFDLLILSISMKG